MNIKWTKNNFYSSNYNKEELQYFEASHIASIHQFQKSHPAYLETPLHHLKELARYLNVAEIRVKDESYRFGLNAFKVMGGIYAIGKYIAKRLEIDVEKVSFEMLQSAELKEKLGKLTFITATDGNHGRGIAWAARELGQSSVVYMPKGSSKQRLQAIRDEGATANITDMNYDDTVRKCAELAEQNNWILVQDTAWDGYEDIPLWIMQGYTTIAKEITEQLEEESSQLPTHIFLQAGVGSFAAAIAAYFLAKYLDNPPTIIIVEPDQADCYYKSFVAPTGTREIVGGKMATIMAGLACGEPNIRAFRILRQYAIASFSCNDDVATLGMRIYGNPLSGDPAIISGESGAVSLGLLYYLRKNSEIANTDILLNESSRVLLISTEGDTDVHSYRGIVWGTKNF